MKRIMMVIVLAVGLSSCHSTPPKPAGADVICKAFEGDAKYDTNISSWVCVDWFDGATSYVF